MRFMNENEILAEINRSNLFDRKYPDLYDYMLAKWIRYQLEENNASSKSLEPYLIFAIKNHYTSTIREFFEQYNIEIGKIKLLKKTIHLHFSDDDNAARVFVHDTCRSSNWDKTSYYYKSYNIGESNIYRGDYYSHSSLHYNKDNLTASTLDNLNRAHQYLIKIHCKFNTILKDKNSTYADIQMHIHSIDSRLFDINDIFNRAISYNHTNIALGLLRDYTIYSKHCEQALTTAISRKNNKFIEQLLELDEIKITLNTINIAIRMSLVELFYTLWRHPLLDKNNKNNMLEKSIFNASKQGCVDILHTLLLSDNISINYRLDRGFYDKSGTYFYSSITALIVATLNNHIEIVARLLKYKDINVNSQDKSGKTALMYAVTNGNIAIIKLLLKHPSIEKNIKDKSGKTAIELTDNSRIKALLTPTLEEQLLQAAENFDVVALRSIVKTGASIGLNINVENKAGETALMIAIKNQHKPSIEFLLQVTREKQKEKSANANDSKHTRWRRRLSL